MSGPWLMNKYKHTYKYKHTQKCGRRRTNLTGDVRESRLREVDHGEEGPERTLQGKPRERVMLETYTYG